MANAVRKAVKKAVKNAIVSAVIEKATETSVGALMKVCKDTATAVATKTKDSKKLVAEIKRFGKKRVMLMKRKKTSATKFKKEPVAGNRKALKVVEKEISLVAKELDKLKLTKVSLSDELTALKGHFKRATAYVSAIEKADKILNKPKKASKKPKAKANKSKAKSAAQAEDAVSVMDADVPIADAA